jgi:hypothetical protein
MSASTAFGIIHLPAHALSSAKRSRLHASVCDAVSLNQRVHGSSPCAPTIEAVENISKIDQALAAALERQAICGPAADLLNQILRVEGVIASSGASVPSARAQKPTHRPSAGAIEGPATSSIHLPLPPQERPPADFL